MSSEVEIARVLSGVNAGPNGPVLVATKAWRAEPWSPSWRSFVASCTMAVVFAEVGRTA
jgi:hypothetical protein